MIFRPATPLALIFLIAFVLLLLSTLSVPVIHSIPLGSFQGWDFGVLGYCRSDGTLCRGPVVGYGTDGLFSGESADDFSLPANARHSLSAILIVHPIAAFMVLICFCLAVAAHFHAPSHSPRYLLAVLIMTIPTLLITLLAFLVDILLFVPHMVWGGWIVLAATILIIASSVVTCAMRRTLVSRKARKKRIAENADMSGANYYEDLNQRRMVAAEQQSFVDSTLPRADSPPPMSESAGMDGKSAQYAAYEMKRHDNMGHDGTVNSDDRVPLASAGREPSVRSSSTGPHQGYNTAGMPMNGNGHMMQPVRTRSYDEYGNPIVDAGAGAVAAGALRHEGSQSSLRSRGSGGRGGAPGYNQRGRGYGPPPRGYGQPRGGPPRGGYGPPPRGYGARGPPRGGYRGRGGYGPPPPGMMPPPGAMRGPPPPGYAGPYGQPSPYSTSPPPIDRAPMHDDYAMGGSAPPRGIGQAVEMDERTGSRSPPGIAMPGAVDHYGLRDSDSDVAGMVGMQQGHMHDQGMRSPTNDYSDRAYVPPRQQWQQPQTMHHPNGRGAISPISPQQQQHERGLSPVAGSPTSPMYHSSHGQQIPPDSLSRTDSQTYYEDVDPRFADEPNAVSAAPAQGHPRESGIPAALTPRGAYDPDHLAPPHQPGHNAFAGAADMPNNSSQPSLNIPHSSGSSNEALQNGSRPDSSADNARSPEGSEISHFTSVSQRGVNPAWRPAGGSAYGGSSASAAQRRREDVILNGNPDFSLPGMGMGGRGRTRGRGRGGVPSNLSLGLTPGGRYPTDI